MENTALILIDIQNDYFPGGAMQLEQPEAAAEKAKALLQAFRSMDLPVIHVQHANLDPNFGFMLPESEGFKIHSSVRPLANEALYQKHYPNAFWQTGLDDDLKRKGIKRIILVGLMTHMCVSTTARAGMERGYEVTVIEDACATRALELNHQTISAHTVHETALAELTLIAQIQSADQILKLLSQAA